MGTLDSIKLSKFYKFLKKEGFYKVRQKGSHASYRKESIKRPLVIPVHSKEVPFYVIIEVLDILRMTKKEFEEIIRKI